MGHLGPFLWPLVLSHRAVCWRKLHFLSHGNWQKEIEDLLSLNVIPAFFSSARLVLDICSLTQGILIKVKEVDLNFQSSQIYNGMKCLQDLYLLLFVFSVIIFLSWLMAYYTGRWYYKCTKRNQFVVIWL